MWNANLSASPAALAKTALGWVTEPSENGIRVVLMCDGMVQNIDAKMFASMPKAMGR